MMQKLLLLFLVLLLVTQFVQAQRELMPAQPNSVERPVVSDPTNPDGSPAGKAAVKKRIREGAALIEKRVFFRETGNRTTLYTVDENDRFVCLENLNLQRILQAIEEKPERSIWKIDGTFTEFKGENFVLITRAVVSPDDYTPPLTPKPSASEEEKTQTTPLSNAP